MFQKNKSQLIKIAEICYKIVVINSLKVKFAEIFAETK